MTSEAGDARQIRLAKNQALFREVNERVRSAAHDFVAHDALSIFCECSDAGCGVQLELTPEEYERVRRTSTRFVVLPSQEIAEVEEVVERNDRYALVEKIEAAARVAAAHDPRRPTD